MNSLENITKKITDDAQLEADNLLAQAKEECTGIIDGYKKQAADYKAELEKKAASEIVAIEERTVSRTDFEKRNIALTVKRDLINSVFDNATKKLGDMSGAKYLSFLADIVVKNAPDSSEIVLNKKDLELYGTDLLALVKQKRTNTNIKISSETGNFCGGLLIKEGKIDSNYTFESLVKNARDSLVTDVASILFK